MLIALVLLTAAVAISVKATLSFSLPLFLLAGVSWGAFTTLCPRATSVLAGGVVLVSYVSVPVLILVVLFF